MALTKEQRQYIGNVVKKERLKIGLSQVEFARLIGKSTAGYIHHIEKGIRMIGPSDVTKFSKETGISPHELRPDVFPKEPLT